MYSHLIDKMRYMSDSKTGYTAPAGLHPWEVKSMAASGVPFTLQEAIAIRDWYFPGEPLEDLFQEDSAPGLLTMAEALRIVEHTRFTGCVMPEMQDIIFQYVKEKVQNICYDRGTQSLMAFCLAVGNAVGVRAERMRRKGAD